MAQIETNHLKLVPFPFDLLESIMEILIADGDTQSARQLSSTCFNMRTRTEVHLFRTIHLKTIYQSLNHFHNCPPPICQCTGNRESEIPTMATNPNLSRRSFYGFSHILDSNPKLARYVKTLKITVAKEHLTDPHIQRILDRLQSVEHLDWHLYGQMPLSGSLEDLPFQMSLRAVARNISKLTLTKINIPLQILLSSCPNLLHLELQMCAGLQMSPIPLRQSSTSRSGAQLRVLKLDSKSLPLFSQTLITVTSDNASIIDITQVHTIETCFFDLSDQARVEELLKSFEKLENLTCTTCYDNGFNTPFRVLKVSSFMTLRTLDISCVQAGTPEDRDPFLGLCNGLQRFPCDSRLEIIMVTLRYYRAFSTEGSYWNGFDEVVTTFRFPHLRLFSIKLSRRCNAAEATVSEESFHIASRAYFQRIRSWEGLKFQFLLTTGPVI